MKSQRQLQLGENIKRIIADIFSRGDLVSFSGGYVTVLEADVSPDAKNVKIYLDIFGGEKNREEIISKLNKIAPQFRFQLAKKLTARSVPEITFMLDKTGENAMRIENLLEMEAVEGLQKKPRKK